MSLSLCVVLRFSNAVWATPEIQIGPCSKRPSRPPSQRPLDRPLNAPCTGLRLCPPDNNVIWAYFIARLSLEFSGGPCRPKPFWTPSATPLLARSPSRRFERGARQGSRRLRGSKRRNSAFGVLNY